MQERQPFTQVLDPLNILNETDHPGIREKLQTSSFTRGDNLEPITRDGTLILSSIREGICPRLFLTKKKFFNKPHWIVVRFSEDHNYNIPEKTKGGLRRFIKTHMNALIAEASSLMLEEKSEEKSLPSQMSTTSVISPTSSTSLADSAFPDLHYRDAEAAMYAQEADDEDETLVVTEEMHYFQGKWIVATQEQLKVLEATQPCIATGMPGAGKTNTAMLKLEAILEKIVQEKKDTEDKSEEKQTLHRVIYVTTSEKLKDKMETNRQASTGYKETDEYKIEFKTYEELLKESVPGCAGKNFVAKEHFLEWFNRLPKEAGLVETLKRCLPEDANLLDSLYQECRNISGYELDNLNEDQNTCPDEYKKMGERQTQTLFSTEYSNKTISSAPKKTNKHKRFATQKKSEEEKPFSKIEKEKLREMLYGIYARYKTYLNAYNLIDPAFFKFEPNEKIYQIVVDEAQDFSPLQLAMLARFAYGCDLSLIKCNQIQELTESMKAEAIKNNTPILIRTKDSYYIYGCPEGGNWKVSPRIESSANFDRLPLSEGYLKRSDPLFDRDLVDILSKHHHAAKYLNISYFQDTNQSLHDALSKLPVYKRIFGEHVSECELTTSQRCPEDVVKLANEILKLKHYITGTLEKGKCYEIKACANAPKGEAICIDTPTESQWDGLLKLIQDPDCVVITWPELVKEAEEKFQIEIIDETGEKKVRRAHVLTVEQAKGLGYKKVIWFCLLNRPHYQTINKLIDYEEYKTHANTTSGRACDPHYEYNPDINALFTTITRAEEYFCMYHAHNVEEIARDKRAHVRVIREILREASTYPNIKTVAPIKPSAASGNWKETAKTDIRNRLYDSARKICKDYYNGEETFNELLNLVQIEEETTFIRRALSCNEMSFESHLRNIISKTTNLNRLLFEIPYKDKFLIDHIEESTIKSKSLLKLIEQNKLLEKIDPKYVGRLKSLHQKINPSDSVTSSKQQEEKTVETLALPPTKREMTYLRNIVGCDLFVISFSFAKPSDKMEKTILEAGIIISPEVQNCIAKNEVPILIRVKHNNEEFSNYIYGHPEINSKLKLTFINEHIDSSLQNHLLTLPEGRLERINKKFNQDLIEILNKCHYQPIKNPDKSFEENLRSIFKTTSPIRYLFEIPIYLYGVTSPLISYIAQPKSNKLQALLKILDDSENAKKISFDYLVYTILKLHAGKDAYTIPAIHFMVCTEEACQVLDKLLDKNPILQNVLTGAAILTKKMKPSTLHYLSLYKTGKKILQKLINIDVITEQLNLDDLVSYSTLDFVPANALFHLSLDDVGRSVLDKIFKLNANIAKKLTVEHLRDLSNQDNNVFFNLCAAAAFENCDLFEKLLDKNSEIAKNLTVDMLRQPLTPKQYSRIRAFTPLITRDCSILQILAGHRPRGHALLLKMLEQNPKLAEQFTFEDLCLFVPERLGVTTNSPYHLPQKLYSVLQKTTPIILEKIYEKNSELKAKVLEDIEKPSQTVEDKNKKNADEKPIPKPQSPTSTSKINAGLTVEYKKSVAPIYTQMEKKEVSAILKNYNSHTFESELKNLLDKDFTRYLFEVPIDPHNDPLISQILADPAKLTIFMKLLPKYINKIPDDYLASRFVNFNITTVPVIYYLLINPEGGKILSMLFENSNIIKQFTPQFLCEKFKQETILQRMQRHAEKALWKLIKKNSMVASQMSLDDLFHESEHFPAIIDSLTRSSLGERILLKMFTSNPSLNTLPLSDMPDNFSGIFGICIEAAVNFKDTDMNSLLNLIESRKEVAKNLTLKLMMRPISQSNRNTILDYLFINERGHQILHKLLTIDSVFANQFCDAILEIKIVNQGKYHGLTYREALDFTFIGQEIADTYFNKTISIPEEKKPEKDAITLRAELLIKMLEANTLTINTLKGITADIICHRVGETSLLIELFRKTVKTSSTIFINFLDSYPEVAKNFSEKMFENNQSEIDLLCKNVDENEMIKVAEIIAKIKQYNPTLGTYLEKTPAISSPRPLR